LERSSDVEFCGVGRLRISLSDMRPVRWALAAKEPFTPLLRNEDTDSEFINNKTLSQWCRGKIRL
jgi:hypothetical protein